MVYFFNKHMIQCVSIFVYYAQKQYFMDVGCIRFDTVGQRFSVCLGFFLNALTVKKNNKINNNKNKNTFYIMYTVFRNVR